MSDNAHPLVTPMGDTTVTPLDLMELGQALLNALATTETLGHTSPGHALDYTHGQTLIRDILAWTSGRQHLAPGCEERVRKFITESGWQRYALERIAEGLIPKDGAA